MTLSKLWRTHNEKSSFKDTFHEEILSQSFWFFFLILIHNKCWLSSHTIKGPSKRILCPKIEFVMYLEYSWFIEKNIFCKNLNKFIEIILFYFLGLVVPPSDGRIRLKNENSVTQSKVPYRSIRANRGSSPYANFITVIFQNIP